MAMIKVRTRMNIHGQAAVNLKRRGITSEPRIPTPRTRLPVIVRVAVSTA